MTNEVANAVITILKAYNVDAKTMEVITEAVLPKTKPEENDCVFVLTKKELIKFTQDLVCRVKSDVENAIEGAYTGDDEENYVINLDCDNRIVVELDMDNIKGCIVDSIWDGVNWNDDVLAFIAAKDILSDMKSR